ncbi:MAG: tetratricopeptide repeat protein, partial [Lysobacterales bacterium]
QQASAEYQVMTTLIKSNSMDAAVSNYEVLKAEYPKSAYTSMAALLMAKARVSSGQFDLAASDLEYAMEHAQPDPVKVIARERLARLKLSQGDADSALKLLDEAPSEVGFEAQFAEVRGDIYMAKGETELAIGSYQAALSALDENVGNRDLIKFKLEALGTAADETPVVARDSGGGEM